MLKDLVTITSPNSTRLNSRSSLTTVLSLALATFSLAALVCGTTGAQEIPRTASGHPDLSGTYDAATLTPLVRPKEYGDNPSTCRWRKQSRSPSRKR